MASRRPQGDRSGSGGRRAASVECSTGGMFFVAPPPLRAAPLGTPGRRRPLVGKITPVPPQNGSMARSANQEQPFHVVAAEPPECSAAEKLAFDELLRVQRGRAEDVGKLIAALGASLGVAAEAGDAAGTQRDRDVRAAKYREEWRVGREDDVLKRMYDSEQRDREALAASERQVKEEALRLHVRRSIHCFLVADRSNDSTTAVTPKARRSNDLFYAQQMDRLLREMDQQHPFAVVRSAIADARAKFQKLLQSSIEPNNALKVVAIDQDTKAAPANGVVTTDTAEADTSLLHLYENVVDARSLAQPTPIAIAAKLRKKTPRESTPVPLLVPSAAFLGNLEKQRDKVEARKREALGQDHWRVVCAARIRKVFVAYQKREQWKRRAKALTERTRHRAATILQTTFLRAVRAFRALGDAQRNLMHRNQSRRIAYCCFWRWIYIKRCGFSTSKFTAIASPALVEAAVRIQSHWRRRCAAREAAFRRAFRSLRAKRRRQRQWRDWRHTMQVTALLSEQLAEWHCRVAIERRRVARELEREQARHASEWAKYASRLEKDVLKSKLSSEWIPQLDPVGGETFYFNVQTSATTSEHPNRALLKVLLKKQRARADALYAERRRRLEQYADALAGQASEATARFERWFGGQLGVRWDDPH